jgi:hypothetical protein
VRSGIIIRSKAVHSIAPTELFHATRIRCALGFCTEASEMRLILLIILIIVVIGALPSWPYSAGWGYYPSGGLGTILVILIILALVGVI